LNFEIADRFVEAGQTVSVDFTSLISLLLRDTSSH